MKRINIRSPWILVLLLSDPLVGQSPKPHEDSKSVRVFVQDFYNWYTPRLIKGKATPTSVLAPDLKGVLFHPEIAKALMEDARASAESSGEIVGLDFDPFVNSQDPARRYEAGGIVRRGGTDWVDVYAVWPGKKRGKPDVVVEVGEREGHCVFVNFHYPEGQDLLGLLKSLKAEREKGSK